MILANERNEIFTDAAHDCDVLDETNKSFFLANQQKD